jgi:uncharacterized protein (TIGR02145 family)
MNYRLLVLTIVIFISTYSLYSSEPLVRFYLQDGSIKSYNLSEIYNIQLPNSPDTLQLQVFTNDGKTFYYPAQLIDTIAFSIGQYGNQYINLWHDGFKWDFAVYKIDSILLYYTKYVAVTIGTQHWMYRNLNVDHFRNGEKISEIRDERQWSKTNTAGWCNYNNDSAIGYIYGKLYNWFAVNDSRGLAPKGWRVPVLQDWTDLEAFLTLKGLNGGTLKESGTEHWNTPNTGATNETGFTALSGGIRWAAPPPSLTNEAPFEEIKYWCTMWTQEWRWTRNLRSDKDNIERIGFLEYYGISVRCIKD